MKNRLLNCRLCNSKNLKKIINLKKMSLGDKYAKQKNKFNQKLEINILQCKKCSHCQTSTIPPREKLYTHYLSRPVAINSSLSDAYKIYAKDLLRFLKKKDDLICEIGSNDGSFLNFFKNKKYKNIIGVEPAKNLSLQANKSKIKTLNEFFETSTCNKIIKTFNKKAKIIINNHSLSNISNIDDVFRNVKGLLEKNGVYTIQTFYTAEVYKKFLLENFNHEHLNYFFVTTINTLANKHGLEVFDAFKIDAKGGSIRTYISHIGDYKINNKVLKIINEEKKFLKSQKYPKRVEGFIKKNSLKIKKIIKDNCYKNIIGYGTSIGATTFLTQYDLGKKIKYLIDDDKFRQNRFSPGFNIQTTNNKIISKQKPDLIIILAPLYFKNIYNRIVQNFGRQNILKIWPQIKLIKE